MTGAEGIAAKVGEVLAEEGTGLVKTGVELANDIVKVGKVNIIFLKQFLKILLAQTTCDRKH